MTIGVLIPLRNGVEFLDECLQSVLFQTWEDWEVLIAVNGYPAGSSVFEAARQREGSRIHVIDLPEASGKADTLNAMVRSIENEWVCLLDVDDVWSGDKLREQVALLDHYDVIGTLAEYFGQKSGPVPVRAGVLGYEDLLGLNHIVNSSAMFRREHGWWDRAWEGIEDYDMWLRIASAAGRFYNVPKVLVRHRIHSGSAFNTRDRCEDVAGLRLQYCRRRDGAGMSGGTEVDAGNWASANEVSI